MSISVHRNERLKKIKVASELCDDLSSIGTETERTESVVLTPRTCQILSNSPPACGSGAVAATAVARTPAGDSNGTGATLVLSSDVTLPPPSPTPRRELTRELTLKGSRRLISKSFSDRAFAMHTMHLNRILEDVVEVTDLGDLVLLATLSGELMKKVIVRLTETADDVTELKKAEALTEKVVNITSWSVLPELRETEDFDKDVATQTEEARVRPDVLIIPDLECEDLQTGNRLTPVARKQLESGGGGVGSLSGLNHLSSPGTLSPSSRKLKPCLSPLRKLPSFGGGGASFRVDGSLYFSSGGKKLPLTDRMENSSGCVNGAASILSPTLTGVNSRHLSFRGPSQLSPKVSFVTKRQAKQVSEAASVDNTDTDTSPKMEKTMRDDDLSDTAHLNPAFTGEMDPFGETFFPDPCVDDGLVRYPIADIHKYVGMFILRCTGEVCMWNPKMVECTGIDETEACGCHISAFLLSSQDQEDMQGLMHMTFDTNETQQTKLSLACQDGVNRCVVTITLVASVYPKGEYLLAYCHERVPTETKIDCILWTVQMMKKHVATLPPSDQAKVVKADIVKLEKVCGRQGAKAWGSVVIRDLFGKLYTHYSQQAEEAGVQLSVDDVMSDVPTEVQTDVRHLPQIIGYLIHNAIRSNAEGGKVRLSVEKDYARAATENTDSAAEESDGGLANGGRRKERDSTEVLIFTVEDDGPGLPEEMLDKLDITSVDKDADRESQHKGFGLMMTSLLTAECGGTLDVSTSAAGTTCHIMIPLLAQGGLDGEQNFAQSAVMDKGLGMQLKALVIQPNAVTRAALCHYMWSRKYAVSIASHADEVTDFNVDLLILNIEDEQAEGKIFEKLKGVPKVELVLTATPVDTQLEETKGLRVLSIPLKPDEVNNVLNDVERHIQSARDDEDKIEQVRKAFRVEDNMCPWERKKKLGSGAFGEVYEAVNLITKGVMAVKIIRIKSHDAADETTALDVLNEVQLMFRLQHPNIIHYFHSQLEDLGGEKQLLIFMEFATGGSLQERLKDNNGPFDAEVAAKYTQDVLQGLHYLHSNNIIHRDIKTANILIVIAPDKKEVCKVTDFGTAREIGPGKRAGKGGDGLARSIKGTPNYMAPEVMNEEPYDSKADVWSVGCLVLELLTGKLPFQHISDKPWNVVRYVCSLSISREEPLTPPAPSTGGASTSGSGVDDMSQRGSASLSLHAAAAAAAENPGVDYGPYFFATNVLQFLHRTVVVRADKRLSCMPLLSLPFIVQGSAEMIKLYRRASMCPHSAKLNNNKLKFGDKFADKDDEENKEDAAAPAAGRSSASDGSSFSGWGSDNESPSGTPRASTSPKKGSASGGGLDVPGVGKRSPERKPSRDSSLTFGDFSWKRDRKPSTERSRAGVVGVGGGGGGGDRTSRASALASERSGRPSTLIDGSLNLTTPGV